MGQFESALKERSFSRADGGNGMERMEPTSGLEPLTCRLRIIVRSRRYST
jgi:hypothetical protein